MRVQVDDYLKKRGKTLDELLSCPSALVKEEEGVQASTDRPLYQSATTGRIRKRPDRLQLSHAVTGPDIKCPTCETVVHSIRALTYHKKRVCKPRPSKRPYVVETSTVVSSKQLNVSDECPKTSNGCQLPEKRAKITEPSTLDLTHLSDGHEELYGGSSDESEQFSDSSEDEWEESEVESVEIKMEHDEDFVKLQDSGAQTDDWCPTVASSFFCVPCRCQFRVDKDLRQHVLDTHRECADSTLTTLGGRPSQGIKMVKFVSGVSCFYECPYCRTLRADVAQLLRHMRQQHPSHLTSAPITCKKAPIKMMKSVRLSDVQGEKYHCGYCRKQMDSFRQLKLHLDSLHMIRECVRCITFFQVYIIFFSMRMRKTQFYQLNICKQ